MSPRITFLLTLAGVLLVGLPLPILTGGADTQIESVPAVEVETDTVWAVLSFTGKPQSVRLRPVGGDWQDVAHSASGAEIELELPIREMVEIEVETKWEEPEVQALSLRLEPTAREAKTETLWKEEGSHTLHSIFTFRW